MENDEIKLAQLYEKLAGIGRSYGGAELPRLDAPMVCPICAFEGMFMDCYGNAVYVQTV